MPAQVPGLLHHLHVEVGALQQALRLEQAAARLELGDALGELLADALERRLHLVRRGDVVRGGEDGELLALGEDLAGQRVELLDRLDLVAEELDARGHLLVRGLHVEHVAAHAELRASEVHVVARVLQVGELAQQDVAPPRLARRHLEQLAEVVLRRADAVDAGDRRHHDDVAAGQQRARGAVAQAVDLVVARRVLLDVRVGARDVRLGLVEVVEGDEVLDRVVGEELAELRPQLRCQRLVRRQHQHRALQALGDVGDGERLARAGDAEQRLLAQPVVDAAVERVDGRRLVTGRRERRDDLQCGHGSQSTGSPPRRPPGGRRRAGAAPVPPRAVLARKQTLLHEVPAERRIVGMELAQDAAHLALLVVAAGLELVDEDAQHHPPAHRSHRDLDEPVAVEVARGDRGVLGAEPDQEVGADGVGARAASAAASRSRVGVEAQQCRPSADRPARTPTSLGSWRCRSRGPERAAGGDLRTGSGDATASRPAMASRCGSARSRTRSSLRSGAAAAAVRAGLTERAPRRTPPRGARRRAPRSGRRTQAYRPGRARRARRVVGQARDRPAPWRLRLPGSTSRAGLGDGVAQALHVVADHDRAARLRLERDETQPFVLRGHEHDRGARVYSATSRASSTRPATSTPHARRRSRRTAASRLPAPTTTPVDARVADGSRRASPRWRARPPSPAPTGRRRAGGSRRAAAAGPSGTSTPGAQHLDAIRRHAERRDRRQPSTARWRAPARRGGTRGPRAVTGSAAAASRAVRHAVRVVGGVDERRVEGRAAAARRPGHRARARRRRAGALTSSGWRLTCSEKSSGARPVMRG